MATPESLHEIEQALGVEYPAPFVTLLGVFTTMVESAGFARAFPGTRLILTVPGIAHALERTPAGLLPFLRTDQDGGHDIFGFVSASTAGERNVAVWAGDAFVAVWENFPDFMLWVQQQIDRHAPPA